MRKFGALIAVCGVATFGAVAGTAAGKTSKPKKTWEVVVGTFATKSGAKACKSSAGKGYKSEKEEKAEGGGYEVEKTYKKKSKAEKAAPKAHSCVEGFATVEGPDTKSK
jgi:hypothetical protein